MSGLDFKLETPAKSDTTRKPARNVNIAEWLCCGCRIPICSFGKMESFDTKEEKE